MVRGISLLILLAYAGSVEAAAYRWVDESGTVHFSDVPIEGAEAVPLDAVRNVADPVEIPVVEPAVVPSSGGAESETQPFRYRTVAIKRPADGSTFGTDGGSLAVSYDIDPPLQAGHRLVAWLDGKRRAAKGRKVSIPLGRGDHRLQLGVLDGDGKVLRRSATVSFNVRETRRRTRSPPAVRPPPAVPLPRR